MSKHGQPSSHADLTIVVFELEESDWHEHATESLWAIPLEEKTVQLDNVPFYIYGISYGDIVAIKPVEGQNEFDGIVKRGGHSTYRIFLVGPESEQAFPNAWDTLGQLGCSFERGTDYLVAVDVPPESDIYKVYAALEAGEGQGDWDFEEGHCGHPLTLG